MESENYSLMVSDIIRAVFLYQSGDINEIELLELINQLNFNDYNLN